MAALRDSGLFGKGSGGGEGGDVGRMLVTLTGKMITCA